MTSFHKNMLFLQCQTWPLPTTVPISALLPVGVRKSSSSSHKPPSSCHIFFVLLPWKTFIRVYCADSCHFFLTSDSLFNSPISGFHSHWACKNGLVDVTCLVANPNSQFSVFFSLLNSRLRLLEIVFSRFPGHRMVALLSFYCLLSIWLQDGIFPEFGPKPSVVSTHSCVSLVPRDDFR